MYFLRSIIIDTKQEVCSFVPVSIKTDKYIVSVQQKGRFLIEGVEHSSHLPVLINIEEHIQVDLDFCGDQTRLS